VRDAKAFAGGVDEFVLEVVGVGECDAVNKAVQRAIAGFELLEKCGDLFVARDVTHETG